MKFQALSISVPVEADLHAGWISDVAERQLPFATARALTKAAFDARDEFRTRGIRKRLNIRNSRSIKGIRSVRAEKRDWPKPQAGVGTLDGFIARHEEGGIQKPFKGRHFAIPSSLITSRRTATGRVRATDKPRNMISSHRAWVDDRRIRGRLPGSRARKASRLRHLYLLKPSIYLEPALGMRKSVHKSVRKTLPGHFDRELSGAIRTSKVRKPRRKTR